ncbi:Mobile element protein [Escherichia coli]|nr:Mobile element protein [Escherichia coli]
MVGLAIPVCFIHPAALLIVMESSSPPGADSKRKLTAVCSHQTRIGNLDAHLI